MTTPIGPANGISECYGRTDGRTKNLSTSAEHLTLVDVRRGEDGFTSIGEAIEAGFATTDVTL